MKILIINTLKNASRAGKSHFSIALLALLFSFALTGCDEESGPGPVEQVEDGGTSGGFFSPEWGDLACQKKMTCRNPILNIERDAVVLFLTIRFPGEKVTITDPYQSAFLCGMQFLESWSEHFGLPSSVNSKGIDQIIDFGKQVLNVTTCQVKSNLHENLDQYFNQNKEN